MAGIGYKVATRTWNENFTSNRKEYVATEGQTTFNATYDVEFIDVYVNGLKIPKTEFTAIDGSTIVLLEACNEDDVVDIVAYNNYAVANVYTKEEVYTKDNVYTKDESYPKTQVYTKEEVDTITDNIVAAVDGIFYESNQQVTSNYTLQSGKNAMVAGPITIADNVTITVSDGSSLTIV